MRRIIRTSVAAALLTWGGAAQALSEPPAVPLETDLRVETMFLPVSAGFRWDDNIYRAPTGEKEDDVISTLGAGAQIQSILKRAWKGEARYQCSADLYARHGGLNHYRNRLQLGISSVTGPVQGWFRKSFLIRRSSEPLLDDWDDRNELGMGWNPAEAWNLEGRYEYSLHRFFSDAAVFRARNSVENGFTMQVFRQLEEHASVHAGGRYGRKEYNRYAVGWEDGSYRLLPGTQLDETWSGWAGIQWYAASVMNEVTMQAQRLWSNNTGSSCHVRSLSWCAGMTPAANLTLQGFVRFHLKRYDAPPLSLPEFQTGFDEEEGQELLSGRVTWECAPRWEIRTAFDRIRAESFQAGSYYVKRVLSCTLQRRF